MFWITHPSYSILPSWLDDCMGKQKTNLALLITSYHNESAMPDFAYLRPQNLLKLVFPWIYMLCARYHYRITDIWQLIQVTVPHNLYYLLVPSTVTSLNTIFFFSSCLPPLSFQLWMQVSLLFALFDNSGSRGDALWPLRHHTKQSAVCTTYYRNLHNTPNYDNNTGFNIQKAGRDSQDHTLSLTSF